MSDQITINVVPDSFVTVTAEEGNENVYLNPITLNQGIINHSTTHISGGSDELLHNALGGLNGGTSGQFYHLTSQEYSNLVTGQVIRPSDTGLFYASSNPSGFITGISDIVYTTGDQNIAGLKNFYIRPQVNGIGVLLSGEGGGGSASGDYLPLSGGTITGDLVVTGFINGDSGNFNNLNAEQNYFIDSNQAISLQNNIESWNLDIELTTLMTNYLDPDLETLSSIYDIEFKSDGSILYVLDVVNLNIVAFNLNIPWNITSGASSIQTYHIGTEFSNIGGFAFSIDGLYMFVMSSISGASNKIVRYNLGTPWDISTASFSQTRTLSLGASSATWRCIRFAPNGNKMFIISESSTFDRIYEISLTTPWSLTSTTVVRFLNTRDSPFVSNSPRSIRFNNDGSRMFFIDGMSSSTTDTRRYIIEVGLPNGYSLSNPNYRGRSIQIDATAVRSLYYNDDYQKCLVIPIDAIANIATAFNTAPKITIGEFNDYDNYNSNNIVADKLTLTSEYDALNVHGPSKFDNSASFLYGLQIGPNYSVNNAPIYFGTNSQIYSNASGIITLDNYSAGNFDKLRFGGSTNSFPSIRRNGAGLDIATADNSNALTTLRAGNTSFNNISGNACTLFGNLATSGNVYAKDVIATGIISGSQYLNLPSNYLPLSGGTLTGDLIVQGDIDATGVVSAPIYNLSLHDASITSDSTIKTWTVLNPEVAFYPSELDSQFFNRGLYFRDDGLRSYIIDSSFGAAIYTLESTEPWLFEDAATIHIKSISGYIAPQGLHFSPDGTKLFIAGLNGANKILLKYNLPIPWDVSSTNATPDQTLDLTTPTGMSGVTDPRYVYFKPDGSKFFLANRSASNNALSVLWEVSLSNNWDISAGSVSSTFSRNIDHGLDRFNDQRSLTFTADGKKMIIVARNSDSLEVYLREYTLITPWSITDNWLTPYERITSSVLGNNLGYSSSFVSIYYNSSAGKAFYPNPSTFGISEINSAFDCVIIDNLISDNNLTTNLTVENLTSSFLNANSIQAGSVSASVGISTIGNVAINNNLAYLAFGGTTRIYGDTNGVIKLTDAGGSSFDKLRFGGISNSFPSIRRNGSGIDIVTADNTNALTTLRAGNTSFNNISGNACTLSGNLAVDTNVLFVDTNLNRVGVGTTSPLAALDVSAFYARAESTFNATNGSIQFKNDPTSTRNASIQYNAGLGFYVNNYSQVLFIDDNIARRGNVGIGTNSPTEKLTVLGNISGSGSVIINNDFESINSTRGVILKAPNGSRFRITIDNSGALTTTAL